ncbi:hypothetical protein [Microbispora sp. CA-102843]|uniref:hypothetical protein n=1 Tax=Microbispora sp. CA-102843 TaxID=3239952 RepID=UPI003D8DABC2
MSKPAPRTKPAAPTSRACGMWRDTDGGHCGNTEGVRLYIVGPRCPTCTPAAVAGRPESTKN